MIALVLSLAAAAAEPALPPMSEVVAVDTTVTDTYTFAIDACERIRAVSFDDRPADAPRSDKVIVLVRNDSGRMCLYKGLALQGSLAGVYRSSLRNPDGVGFFVPPGGEIAFRIKPDVPDRARVAISMQIPPGSGLVILEGHDASTAPPRPGAAPSPPAAQAP